MACTRRRPRTCAPRPAEERPRRAARRRRAGCRGEFRCRGRALAGHRRSRPLPGRRAVSSRRRSASRHAGERHVELDGHSCCRGRASSSAGRCRRWTGGARVRRRSWIRAAGTTVCRASRAGRRCRAPESSSGRVAPSRVDATRFQSPLRSVIAVRARRRATRAAAPIRPGRPGGCAVRRPTRRPRRGRPAARCRPTASAGDSRRSRRCACRRARSAGRPRSHCPRRGFGCGPHRRPRCRREGWRRCLERPACRRRARGWR